MSELEFDGSERFEILRRVGAGGMGVVYEAIDRERDRRVALKTFRAISNDALIQLKDEFRALQDVQHENLIRLEELIEDAGNWFFTMELIDGVDFVEHVGTSSRGPTGSMLGREQTLDLADPNGAEPLSPRLPRGALDEAKLRHALVQLVDGLDALHAAGKIHRDIKPQNVLVTRDERVVILDFGLVQDVSRGDPAGEVVGTVSYMAPEQAAGDHVGAAADWYAVGALLYEALTGRVPFDGHYMHVMAEKQERLPSRPSAVARDVPADLDELCMRLLQVDPAARPTGIEILDQLRGGRARLPSMRLPRVTAQAGRLFVGRNAQLAVLDAALAEASAHATVAVVRGVSGVGKSALVKQFLESRLDADRATIVLAGRCYERESVPYKAFDGIIDELTRFLGGLSPASLDELLPERVAFAAQVFRVLRGIPAIARRGRPAEPLDPQHQRALLFAVVRELFEALARRYRLVLVIDDLQWTDAESLALLRALLRAPDAPAILYLATLRPTEAAAIAIPEIEQAIALAASCHDLTLDALSAEAAEELVGRLASAMGVSPSQSARAIATEAQGHPLFIQELLQHGAPAGASLDDAIMDRVARLGGRERLLIELVAVAGRPLAQATLARAADVEFGDLAGDVDTLRAMNLIRSSGTRRNDAVEPYHDRVRGAVLAGLAATARTRAHLQLASALEEAQKPDPETLANHWRDAGKPERAVGHALAAADQAVAAVAFGRAARLYRMALELGIPTADEQRRVEVLLADALANDGQGPTAAQAYLAAAANAPAPGADDRKRRLTRRAAEQLLRAGHINEGLAHVRTVLADMGIRVPTSPRVALASLLYQRAALRLRGLRYTPRAEAECPADELERIDACWTVALLGFVDTLRGADFGTRHLRRALAAGEPHRLARAVAVEAVYASNIGRGDEPRARELLALATQLATISGSAYADAFVRGATGVVEHAAGRFAIARHHA
ncbi:MAG: protein kinase, partial [Kofleriaceae bacterium]